jgi:hypothetical protein
LIEKYGIDLKNLDQDDMLKIIDLALKISYSGGIKFDKNNGIITIYSKNKNKYLVVWSFLISCYFEILNYKVDTIPRIFEISDLDSLDTFIIKISKSNIPN